MMERVLEFNRLELKRRLHNEEEEYNLVLQLKELIQNAFRGR